MEEPSPLLLTLFSSYLGLERSEERQAFLDYACRDDPEMRKQIENLASVHDEAGEFFSLGHTKTDSDQTTLSGNPEKRENTTEAVGATIGRYQLLDSLGEGGCGVVYLAEQTKPVKRHVALKIIRLGMDTKSVIARFEMERQSLAMMSHPNIARVYDVGTTRSGRPFFVMELVDGQKITDYCDNRNLGIPQRLKLFIKICQAVQHAHQKGVIHRDLKPSNILIGENDGEAIPKVIDFGIAKATASDFSDATAFTLFGQFVGTPAYMSPEQAAGHHMDIDTRSDIFSLGSLLYELLTGRPPFDPEQLRRSGPEEIRHILLEVEPREPSALIAQLKPEDGKTIAAQRGCEPGRLRWLLKGDLDRIVMKALEKDRRRRYGTADSFVADIMRYLNFEPVSARPSGRMYRFMMQVRRNKVVYAAGLLVFLSLIIGFGVSFVMYLRANQALNIAENARANEVMLREKSQTGMTIAQAAVLVKYGNLEMADKLIYSVQSEDIQPTLESAETFRALGYWHARNGQLRQAANRYAAVAYFTSNVDGSDAVSFDLLPAAALLCESGEIARFEQLRLLGIERFGDSTNTVVAERMIKACLILPADAKMMKQFSPLINCLETGGGPAEKDLNSRTWRNFSMALAKYRQRDLQSCMTWGDRAFSKSYNPAREAMATILQSMCLYRMGRGDEAKQKIDPCRKEIKELFKDTKELIEKNGYWQEWLNAHILLREADSLIPP